MALAQPHEQPGWGQGGWVLALTQPRKRPGWSLNPWEAWEGEVAQARPHEQPGWGQGGWVLTLTQPRKRPGWSLYPWEGEGGGVALTHPHRSRVGAKVFEVWKGLLLWFSCANRLLNWRQSKMAETAWPPQPPPSALLLVLQLFNFSEK